jgi:chaperonin GroES
MKTIKPAPNQLFCKPDEAEKTTKSGFILQSVEKPKTAQVINIGDTVSTYKPKDTVIYKSYATTELKIDEVEYILIHQDDVLGVVVET